MYPETERNKPADTAVARAVTGKVSAGRYFRSKTSPSQPVRYRVKMTKGV
jgi:hypothetical protein